MFQILKTPQQSTFVNIHLEAPTYHRYTSYVRTIYRPNLRILADLSNQRITCTQDPVYYVVRVDTSCTLICVHMCTLLIQLYTTLNRSSLPPLCQLLSAYGVNFSGTIYFRAQCGLCCWPHFNMNVVVGNLKPSQRGMQY